MCKDPVAGKSCTRENMEATEASVGESRVRRRERWGGEVGKEREEGKREQIFIHSSNYLIAIQANIFTCVLSLYLHLQFNIGVLLRFSCFL